MKRFVHHGYTQVDGNETVWSGPCRTSEEAESLAEIKIMETFGSASNRCRVYLEDLKVMTTEVRN